MPDHLVTVAYETESGAPAPHVKEKIGCLEDRLHRMAEELVPGRRVQFTVTTETLDAAIKAVDDAIAACDASEYLIRQEPPR